MRSVSRANLNNPLSQVVRGHFEKILQEENELPFTSSSSSLIIIPIIVAISINSAALYNCHHHQKN